MGVGIYLNGQYKSPAKRSKGPARDWLTKIEAWLEDDIAGDKFWGNFLTRCRHGKTHDERPALFVFIHPAGEDVEFIVPEPGRILVSAKTSTVGPGYHTALCHLVQRFGKEFKVNWNPEGEDDDDSQDETGYFFSGDRDAVEKEILVHLQSTAENSLELLQSGNTLVGWNMSIGHGFTSYPGDLRTPLGARSKKWIRAVKDDPRKGIDIYPWWDEGLAPSFYLGRALCEMWSSVCWRPALIDEEIDSWDSVHRDLCQAFAADSTLNFPWREWAELIDILNASDGAPAVDSEVMKQVRMRAAKVPAQTPLIGYRRYPVKVDLLDGWSIKIPGIMAEKWEEHTWSAWDGRRTVWVNNARVTKHGKDVPTKELLAAFTLDKGIGKPLRHRDGKLIGNATFREIEENGEILRNLQAISVVDGNYALCNIYYPTDADDDWAVDTWKSLLCR